MEVTGIKIVVNTARPLPEGQLSDYPGIFNIQHLCTGPVPGRATYLVSVGMLYLFSATAVLKKIADDYEQGQVALPGDSSSDQDDFDFENVGQQLAFEREH